MTTNQQTTKISTHEIGELINNYGTMKLSAIPANSHFVAKLIEKVQTREITEPPKKPGDDPVIKHIYSVQVEYSDPEYEPVQFKLQVGEGAAKRMLEKYPDESYVGKNAYFSKTKYGAVYPQFINPFEGELNAGKPAFIKKQGGNAPIKQVAPQATTEAPDASWATDIVMHLSQNPDEFNTKYFNTSFKEGVTAPWAFIDEFRDTEKQQGAQGTHTQEDILNIYHAIVQATMESRTN